MFFNRNEIHIQAFQEIPPSKSIPGNSSSSTFHHSQELIISNYQKNAKKIRGVFSERITKANKIEAAMSWLQKSDAGVGIGTLIGDRDYLAQK